MARKGLASRRWFYPLVYGLLNLTHWFSPDRVWMGVMHIPLLIIPLVALLMPMLESRTK
jgi:hypothetical protein